MQTPAAPNPALKRSANGRLRRPPPSFIALYAGFVKVAEILCLLRQDGWSQVARFNMKYAVVIEKAEGNYSAYGPDLPGCGATGFTVQELESETREVIAFDIQGRREDGSAIPEPTSKVEYVDLAA